MLIAVVYRADWGVLSVIGIFRQLAARWGGVARPRAFGGHRERAKATLFHRSARHGHVRIKDVALGHPFSIHLLRGQHPLAVVKMGTVSARDHIRPAAIADIAAALGGSDGDLDLDGATIHAGLAVWQRSTTP